MIVPDRKVENYLDSSPCPGEAADLCRVGVLPPCQGLKAAALIRDNGKWRRLFVLLLRGWAVLFLCGAAFFLTLYEWTFLQGREGYAVLCALFAVAALVSRFSSFSGRLAEYGAVLMIGLLVFLPELSFGTGLAFWRSFAVWTLLLFVWASASARPGMKILFFVLLNVAAFLLAWHSLLPAGLLSPAAFLWLLSYLNGVFLVVKETAAKVSDRPVWHSGGLSMLFLSFCFVPALLLPVRNGGEGGALSPSDWFFVWSAVCGVFWGIFYAFFVPDEKMERLNGLFSLLAFLLFVYRLLSLTPFPAAGRWALFGLAVFGAAGIFCRTMRRISLFIRERMIACPQS